MRLWWTARQAADRPDLRRGAAWALVLMLAQVASGAFFPLGYLNLLTQLLHTGLIAGFWGVLSYLCYLTLPEEREAVAVTCERLRPRKAKPLPAASSSRTSRSTGRPTPEASARTPRATARGRSGITPGVDLPFPKGGPQDFPANRFRRRPFRVRSNRKATERPGRRTGPWRF